MVTVMVERNDYHPQGESQKTVGTYEWVQLTYGELRISPNGDPIANFNILGYWELEDGSTWSDVIIG